MVVSRSTATVPKSTTIFVTSIFLYSIMSSLVHGMSVKNQSKHFE